MFSTTFIVTQQRLFGATRYALAVLLLTSVHHAYGAYAYNTAWHLHAVFVSAFAAAAIIGSLVVVRRNANETVREIAFWVFTVMVLVFPVAIIGLFDGAYDHALKDALHFAGASSALMNLLFPPPTYELPRNAFFEVSGVMQVVPGSITAWLLYRLVRSRFGRIVVAPKSASFAKPAQIGVCLGQLGPFSSRATAKETVALSRFPSASWTDRAKDARCVASAGQSIFRPVYSTSRK